MIYNGGETQNRTGDTRILYKNYNGNGISSNNTQYNGRPRVGDLLSEIEELRLINPKTFTTYYRKFRRLVAGVMNIASDKSKHDYVNAGNNVWRTKVDSVFLNELTPIKIIKWRSKYLKAAKQDPLSQRRANTTINSTLRNSKTLFSLNYTSQLSFSIPLNPFDGVSIGSSTTRKYKSDIDFTGFAKLAKLELLVKIPPIDPDKLNESKIAYDEAVSRNQQFKILLLGFGGGLRRGEIDNLLWSKMDFKRNTVTVQTTEFSGIKTEESERTIDVHQAIMKLFSQFRKQERGEFVIQSYVAPKPDAKYHHYRCDRHFKKLIKWLRNNGISQVNAIHELRKEYGSRVCDKFGVYAAKEALGHSNIRTTEASYLEKKQRTEINVF